jgi:uncharacterized protein (TIGR02145 family)
MKTTRFYFAWVCLILLLAAGCKKEEEQTRIIERGTMVDIDGNTYGTVKIGEHWWMAENLKVTRFNDGTPLSELDYTIEEDTLWERIGAPAYCSTNDSLFGLLYNGYALMHGKNIAPEGWHVPTDDEWKELEKTIGMDEEEAGQTGWRGKLEANALASKYNAGWPANNQDDQLYGSDAFGFNAVPSGVRAHDGRTNIQNNSSWWWSASNTGSEFFYRSIDTYHTRIFRQTIIPAYGMSIRCIKD